MLAVGLSIVPGIVRAATYIYDSGTNEVASLLGSLAQGDELKILNADTRVISTASDDLVTKNDVSILIDGGWLEETATQAGRAGGLCNTLGVTGLSLDIVNGGTYHVTTPNRGFFKLGGTGSRIRVEGGSLLLSDITEYAWGSGFGNAKDCTIALTNATMTAFVFRFGLDSKKATGCRLLVHDSTFYMDVPQATPQFTGRRYFEWRSGCSVSNEMVVSGSSVAGGFSTFDMNGAWDLLRIQDTAKASPPVVMNGVSNRVEVLGGELSSGSCRVNGRYNRLLLSGGLLVTGNKGTLTMGGNGPNLIRQTGGTCSAPWGVTIGGFSNRYEFVDGTMDKSLTFSGTNGHFSIGAKRANGVLTFGAASKDCLCELAAAWTNNAGKNAVVLGGTNNVFVLKDGTEYYTPGDVSVISFAGKPNGRLVISNATYTMNGRVCVGGGNVDAFDWTNSPNAAIEFRGTNPLMRCVSTPNWKAWVLGTASGQPLLDPVHFKFVIPEQGYAAAPMQNQVPNRTATLYGNTVFEIDGSAYKGREPVPLFYTAGGWLNMSQTVVDQLNASAILPPSWTLVWDKWKTIYAKPPPSGSLLTIR